MIKANFNAYSSYVTDSLYQWEKNRILSVTGLNLTVAPEVHFSNANMDKAIVRQATLTDHIVNVDIPNSLLQSPLTISAHIGIYEKNTFKVLEVVEIPIIPKKRPSDYVIENTDNEIYSFEALQNAIANMVKSSDFENDRAMITARIDTIIANSNTTDGNSELVDNRIGYDGKTYPSSGTAIRNQSEDIVNTLIRSGVYDETVIEGIDNKGFYVYKSSGLVAKSDNSRRAHIVYDVSQYVGKSVLIQSKIDSTSMINYFFATSEDEVISGYPVGVLDCKTVAIIPENADKLYVNYTIANVETSNVFVKVIDTVNISTNLSKMGEDIVHSNARIDNFAESGLLSLIQSWEFGGISTTGQIYSPDDFRIRTVDFYKTAFDKIYYDIAEGYRLLAVFYTYDENTDSYVWSRTKGYVVGTGELLINEGEYVRFTLRGVDDFTFTGDEFKYLGLYHKPTIFLTKEDVDNIVSDYEPYSVPDYWTETLREKETEIKNIVFDSVSKDNDIAMFFTIADPHYPANTGVSTSLMKYLSQKCGIGLTLCLGDLITDSNESREEGLQRIQDGIINLKNMSERMILTQGNHDTNVQINDSNGQLSANRIVYDKEWILHTSNKLLSLTNIVFDELGKAFYYDDDIQKIRFISLDSFEGKTYEIVDGILKSLNLGKATDRQISWLRNVALQNVPDNYSVITFSHLAPYSPYISNGSEFVTINAGQMGNGSSVLTEIKQFIADGGDYIGHFAGHLHHDFISAKDGIISVHSLNDGTHWRQASYFGEGYEFVGDSPKKVAGTVNECAFDVVIVNKTTRHVDLIRVGAGNNRTFDY